MECGGVFAQVMENEGVSGFPWPLWATGGQMVPCCNPGMNLFRPLRTGFPIQAGCNALTPGVAWGSRSKMYCGQLVLSPSEMRQE